jgi:hypothetical protein
MAVLELREQSNSSAEVAAQLGISAARVGQLIDGGTRSDGIRLELIRQGLILAQQHGRLQPGDDKKISQALAALSWTGRRSQTQTRGIATRLATIRTTAVDTSRMTATEKRLWRRALAHAYDVLHGDIHKPMTPFEEKQ